MTENLLVSLNDIEEKEASWLVPQRMPKGQIIILAGDGGSGKTSCWCSLAAAISTGAFEVAISEVKSSELSYGNLSTLLCQVFRNRSSQPCLSDAAQEQIRAILNVK